jgi:hypothetical protein
MTGTKRQRGGFVNGLPIAEKQTGAYGPHPTAYQQRIRNLLDQGPAVTLPPTEVGPIPKISRHSDGCECVECHNAGVRYGDYLKQKQLNEL